MEKITNNLNRKGREYSKTSDFNKKLSTSQTGLEPATFRLTAERANQLRH
jgi:hypothetical protein